jgi:hypothetical protein
LAAARIHVVMEGDNHNTDRHDTQTAFIDSIHRVPHYEILRHMASSMPCVGFFRGSFQANSPLSHPVSPNSIAKSPAL